MARKAVKKIVSAKKKIDVPDELDPQAGVAGAKVTDENVYIGETIVTE